MYTYSFTGLLVLIFLAYAYATYIQPSSLKIYDSADLGIKFEYPSTYFLSESEVGFGQRRHYSIILTTDTQGSRDMITGKAVGEGPTAITIDAYQNDIDGYSTEDWIRGSGISNFRLSNGALKQATVSGHHALQYSWSGLYEADSIVVATRRYVLSFTATHLTKTDQIRIDFEDLIKTVKFE